MSNLGREHFWRSVATVSVLTVVLYVGGVFPLKQSLAIGVPLLLAMQHAARLASPAHGYMSSSQEFQPYYVQISPNWYSLLTDYKIVEGDTEWKQVSQSLEGVPLTEYRVLRSGLRYTVLNQRARDSLIYWNNHHVFQTGVDLWADAEPVGIEPDDEHKELERLMSVLRDRGGKAPVRFFCKLGLIETKTLGYLLGLEVPDWWWKKNKESCPRPLQVDDVPLTGQVRLVVSVIPYSEFLGYEGKSDQRATLTLNQHREQFGWKTEERDIEDRLLVLQNPSSTSTSPLSTEKYRGFQECAA